MQNFIQPIAAGEVTSRSGGTNSAVRHSTRRSGPPRNIAAGTDNEEQCYLAPPNPTVAIPNISVSGGHLTISARKEYCSGDSLPADAQTVEGNNQVGNVSCSATPTPYPYSSGRIHTRVMPLDPRNSWRHGRVEIRARLPYGQGTWPAFWMMPVANTYGPWPASGEIDIMETVSLDFPHNSGDFLQSNLHFCHWGLFDPDPHASNDAQTNCNALSVQGFPYRKFHAPMRITDYRAGRRTWSRASTPMRWNGATTTSAFSWTTG